MDLIYIEISCAINILDIIKTALYLYVGYEGIEMQIDLEPISLLKELVTLTSYDNDNKGP